jgi:hypothetical protein
MNQESEPKAAAFGNRFRAALQSKRRDLIQLPQGVLQIKPTHAAGEKSKFFRGFGRG